MVDLILYLMINQPSYYIQREIVLHISQKMERKFAN